MIVESTSATAASVTGAIRDAARATGASFDYLLKTAVRESNLDPTAKSASSSATGLFQFVDQTWLDTLKTAGPQLGYADAANDIVRLPSGQLTVPDPARRREIMALRNDPAAASAMAAAFTQRNAAMLTEKLGRAPSGGELYIAHFMGPAGAVQLISAAANTPNAKAADLFPEAAGANRSIFFDRGGGGRSLSQVYDLLVAKHDKAPSAPAPVGSTATSLAVAPAATGDDGPPTRSPLYLAPLPGEVSAASQPARAADRGPVFHSLFQTERRGAVSSFVSDLWGAPSRQPTAQAAASSSFASASVNPLELFRTGGSANGRDAN